jgi:hypothetical protein
VRITLVDRRNHHLFQPLLYQVATAALSASDIARPIRRILRRQANSEVILGEAKSIDRFARKVRGCVRAGPVQYRWECALRMCGRIVRPVSTPGSPRCPISHRSIGRLNSLPTA